MPAWETYKQEARARGALALELFVAVSAPVAAPEALRAVLPDHLAYQGELERAGKLAFAGPLSDETGTEMIGMGMMVYRAETFEAARALAEADPMHKAGARSFTLRKWLVNEGSLTLSVGLSGRTVVLG